MTNAEPASVPNGSTERQTATILMVGGPHRNELTQMMVSEGHRVLYPPTLAEALARIDKGDVLLLDVALPGEPEAQALDTLRQSENAWQTPVIIVAGQTDVEAAARCLGKGALEVITWPVSAPLLLGRLRDCVWRKQRREQQKVEFELNFKAREEAEQLVASLIPLGVSMVNEKDPVRLLELILTEGMRLTDCEGGTIYMRGADETLGFILVRNDMLDINMGGSTGKPITFPPLKLYDDSGKPNHQYVANHAALTGQTVNIADAYSAGRFDFSGTRRFDANTGYRSQSFLTVPLKNAHQQVIGVLQLINARDPRTGVVTAFDSAIQPTIEAFAVLAAAILEAYRNRQLGIA